MKVEAGNQTTTTTMELRITTSAAPNGTQSERMGGLVD